MGTNYYLHTKPPCPACGRGYEPLHIGKSSAGWYFALHVMPEDGINSLADWEARWNAPGARIEDEYGMPMSAIGMRAKIVERTAGKTWDELHLKPPYGYNSWATFHRDNGSEEGENGLLRCREAQHGDGTYTLCKGEFS